MDLPEGVRIVRNTYPEAIQELATAKIWVSNVRLIKYFKQGLQKKDEQVYIQTWHGSLGIKKIDGDANQKFWERSTWDGFEDVDSKAVDYLISNSDFENKVYKSAFWDRGEIRQLGHPRNDIFFTDNDPVKKKVYDRLGIDHSKKIILYVPSYRDNDRLYCSWHGSLGIKKIDGDANQKFWERSTWDGFEDVDSKAVDYLISNSDFENKVYKSAFWDRGEIRQLGHPRNDIFFTDNDPVKKKVYDRLGIDHSKKIILYVPSYRDNDRLYCYFMDYEKVVQACNEKFGGDWIMCVRLHPRAAKYSEKILMPSKNVIDCSSYPDIQELLVSAECAITDYSSCIFDYLLTYNPAFIYARDLDEFDEERGFYYPFSTTPLSVARNNDELVANIFAFDVDSYRQKVKNFIESKGCIDDGNSSKRVVELIKESMQM